MQIQSFHEQGFLAVEDALAPEEIEQLRSETVRICRGQCGEVKGLPPIYPDDNNDDIIQRTLCIHFPYKVSKH